MSSLSRRPCSKDSMVACTSVTSRYASVEAHHTITRRSHSFSVRKVSMSAISCSASSILLAPVLTRVPGSRLTQLWSNTASMATMPSRSPEMAARSGSSSTPAVRAASRALAEMGSHAPKTMSSSEASGTKSLIIGSRPSSRLPSLMWAIWVSDPIGAAPCERAARTPAMKVEATAPRPGVRTPRRPEAGAMLPVLAHAREVLARTVDLARYTHQLREGRGGSLRVGMIDAAAVEHFSETLRRFRDHRPDLDLRLTVTSSAALLDRLRRAELDLVVCVEPPGLVESLA